MPCGLWTRVVLVFGHLPLCISGFGDNVAPHSAPNAPATSHPFPVTERQPSLLRVLGVAFGVAILVGNTISVGILRTPGDIAAALPSTPWFLGVWIAGGLYAMLGALTLAELAVMIPQSGGNYVFARRALGEYPGFVIGWTDWLSSSAATAASAIAFGEVVARSFPAIGVPQTTTSILAVMLFTAVQWPGVKQSDRSQQLLSVIKVAALLTVALAGLASTGSTAGSTITPVALPTATPGTRVVAPRSVTVTADGTVVLAAGAVLAVSPDGKVKWRTPLPGSVETVTAIGQDVLARHRGSTHTGAHDVDIAGDVRPECMCVEDHREMLSDGIAPKRQRGIRRRCDDVGHTGQLQHVGCVATAAALDVERVEHPA